MLARAAHAVKSQPPANRPGLAPVGDGTAEAVRAQVAIVLGVAASLARVL